MKNKEYNIDGVKNLYVAVFEYVCDTFVDLYRKKYVKFKYLTRENELEFAECVSYIKNEKYLNICDIDLSHKDIFNQLIKRARGMK